MNELKTPEIQTETKQVKSDLERKVIKLPLRSIRAYENNAKQHPMSQIEKIRDSIQISGYNDFIEVDENNVILAGHGRLKAWYLIDPTGNKTIKVTVCDKLTESEKKAYRIAHNKLTMITEFDDEILSKEFKLLNDVDFDMELTGFTKEDIDAKLKLNEAENENLFGDRHEVIMLVPPEAPRLKERMMLKCKRIEDYERIRAFFNKNSDSLVETLLGLVK